MSKHLSMKHEGREIDALEVFCWPFLIGGEHDGQRVPGSETLDKKLWRMTDLVVGEVTYVRHRYHGAGFIGRIYYFIATDLPSWVHEPYLVTRRILNTHPDLLKLPDIEWNKKGAKRGIDWEG